MIVTDITARREATRPDASFIMQAPAGSGKTEILIQRYLCLLATVKSPEQIVAITFTRKAANEMRERILQALAQASANKIPTSAHEADTLQYASRVLLQDRQYNWQLTSHPARLRVMTIDSLCQQLVQAMPHKSIAFNQVADNSTKLYRTAAENCLDYVLTHPDWQQDIICLLTHLDNRQDKLLELFIHTLEQRDQWLGPLHHARLQDKEQVEAGLYQIEQHGIARFVQTIPMHLQQEFCNLVQSIAKDQVLQEWVDFNTINREICTALAPLLYTTTGTLRQALAKRHMLLTTLDAMPDFASSLFHVSKLPSPDYDARQWEVLQALFRLLPLLAAHLNLIFQETRSIDFTGVAELALEALGDDDEPTDLALFLDHQIHHLLIDEFQDTSITQYALLTRLVQEWEPDGGKTIFVVGDPMQSIYRFRGAEVGLFLRVRNDGIGPIKPEFLQLVSNFRSDEQIINWVNQHFGYIFPQHDDIASGAVSLHHAIPVRTLTDSIINAISLDSADAEAQAIVSLVEDLLARYPQETIAILVRARGHLTAIMQHLRARRIPCQGTDIDELAALPHIRDVWSLTRVLFTPADNTAWLALLASPLCGIEFADLEKIAHCNPDIWQTLEHIQGVHIISPEAKQRACHVAAVFKHAWQTRAFDTTANWIRATLQGLYAAQIFTTTELQDLEQYWQLLDKFDINGKLPELSRVEQELKKLYSQNSTPSRLNIMTIHKSKGLEFDFVILPSMGKAPQVNEQPLMRWLKLPGQEHDTLLFSPIRSAQESDNQLYNYLAELEKEKNRYEIQRLLYVAVTRAKRHLYMFDCNTKKVRHTFRDYLRHQEFITQKPGPTNPDTITTPTKFYRLPQEFYHNGITIQNEFIAAKFPLENQNHARIVGIIIHELLQWICTRHISTLTEVPWKIGQQRLQYYGLADHPQLMHEITTAIEKIMTDEAGAWIISSHYEEHNEFELLTLHQGKAVTRIIDRTFIADGKRWIIDFKTGALAKPEHRSQLNEYAKLLAPSCPLPICCGLYYLKEPTWHSWEYVAELA